MCKVRDAFIRRVCDVSIFRVRETFVCRAHDIHAYIEFVTRSICRVCDAFICRVRETIMYRAHDAFICRVRDKYSYVESVMPLFVEFVMHLYVELRTHAYGACIYRVCGAHMHMWSL